MVRVTLDLLKKLNICLKRQREFIKFFGEEFVVTEATCHVHRDDADWHEAARFLLTGRGLNMFYSEWDKEKKKIHSRLTAAAFARAAQGHLRKRPRF